MTEATKRSRQRKQAHKQRKAAKSTQPIERLRASINDIRHGRYTVYDPALLAGAALNIGMTKALMRAMAEKEPT